MSLGVTCGDDDDDCGGSGGGGGECDDCVQDGALAIASRISCDSRPHTIIPKSSDGCWGSSTPAADIAAAVPRQHVHYAGAAGLRFIFFFVLPCAPELPCVGGLQKLCSLVLP